MKIWQHASMKDSSMAELVDNGVTYKEPVEKLEERRKFRTFEFQEVDSLGTDRIPTIVIKELSREMAPYLAYLVNQIFCTGIFPEQWRHGIISPIFEAGRRKNKLNYRLVTITNSLSKVWERIANNQMTSYYWRFNIIDRSQHAYQVGKGCDTYWADLIAKICFFFSAMIYPQHSICAKLPLSGPRWPGLASRTTQLTWCLRP